MTPARFEGTGDNPLSYKLALPTGNILHNIYKTSPHEQFQTDKLPYPVTDILPQFISDEPSSVNEDLLNVSHDNPIGMLSSKVNECSSSIQTKSGRTSRRPSYLKYFIT